jgi:hypothetical protein
MVKAIALHVKTSVCENAGITSLVCGAEKNVIHSKGQVIGISVPLIKTMCSVKSVILTSFNMILILKMVKVIAPLVKTDVSDYAGVMFCVDI